MSFDKGSVIKIVAGPYAGKVLGIIQSIDFEKETASIILSSTGELVTIKVINKHRGKDMNTDIKDLRKKYKGLAFRQKQLALRKKMWEGIRGEKSFCRQMEFAHDGQLYDVEIVRLNNEHFTITIDGQDAEEGEFATALAALAALEQQGFTDHKSLDARTKTTYDNTLKVGDQVRATQGVFRGRDGTITKISKPRDEMADPKVTVKWDDGTTSSIPIEHVSRK